MFYILKGEGKSAIRHFQNSVDYFKKVDSQHFLALSLDWIGHGFYLLGDLSKAKEYIEQGLKTHEKSIISWGSSNYYSHLGLVHHGLGEFSEAKSCFIKAVMLSQESKEKHNEAWARIYLGQNHIKIDPAYPDQAKESVLQGIAIAEELMIKPIVSYGYLCLGDIHAQIGEKDGAIKNLKMAENMYQEMNIDYWLAKTRDVLDRLQNKITVRETYRDNR